EDHRWNLVLYEGDELAAYAISWVVSGETHLLNFAVRPDLQGKGVGRLFFRWLLDEARRAGDNIFLLEVRASNERAKHLYESEGLHVVMKRDSYYPDSGEDALVMMCFLQKDPEEK
ncbi:ribosomal protein S18-alanine N-acetyltransferase, partial [bacterium]|nr:ribosomal protein S18-alanine N-acetyltransferase [bacterium]